MIRRKILDERTMRPDDKGFKVIIFMYNYVKRFVYFFEYTCEILHKVGWIDTCEMNVLSEFALFIRIDWFI